MLRETESHLDYNYKIINIMRDEADWGIPIINLK